MSFVKRNLLVYISQISSQDSGSEALEFDPVQASHFHGTFQERVNKRLRVTSACGSSCKSQLSSAPAVCTSKNLQTPRMLMLSFMGHAVTKQVFYSKQTNGAVCLREIKQPFQSDWSG